MIKLLVLPVAMVTLGGWSDLCRNTEIARAKAPDGLHVAVLFERDCDATTGFSTQISILRAEEQASESGNTFVSDDNHGVAASGDWGGPWAEATWSDKDHLLIRYASGSRIFEQRSRVSGVSISYEETDR